METVAWGPSVQATHDAAAHMDSGRSAKTANMSLFPGGEHVELNTVQPTATVARGKIDLGFTPGRGADNAAKQLPPVPIQQPVRQTPVPAKAGCAWEHGEIIEQGISASVDYLEFLRVQATQQFVKDWVKQDAAIIQASMQSCGTLTLQRTMNAIEPRQVGKDKKKKKKSDQRTRIHGWSRKGGAAGASTIISGKRVISSRRLANIIRASIHGLTVDVICSNVAVPGNGGIAPDQSVVGVDPDGKAHVAGPNHIPQVSTPTKGYPDSRYGTHVGGSADDESLWHAWFPEYPPPIDSAVTTPQLPVTVVEKGGTDKLVAFDDAKEVSLDLLDNWVDKIKLSIDQRGVTGYRSWNFMQLVKDRRTKAGYDVTQAIEKNLYKFGSRRRGVQLISTRGDVRKHPPGQYFLFSGKPAVRFIGRPPLPEGEWLRRYRARLAKRRKTNRRNKSKGVKVPRAKWGRPPKMYDAGLDPK